MRLISYLQAIPYHTSSGFAGCKKRSDKLCYDLAFAGQTRLSQGGRAGKEGKIVGSIDPFRSGTSCSPLFIAGPRVFECQQAIVMHLLSLRIRCLITHE